MGVVVGVDSSTQSCTAVVRDAESGAVLARASAPHPLTTPPVSEQHPDAWWDALRQVMAQIDRAGVLAMAVDGQGHGLVALDEADAVIRPAKLWNDTTSTPEARELIARLGRAEWARRAGSVPIAAFTITKLLWLARHEPEGFARLRHVLLPHDWLNWRLTGRRATDRSEATGTGWYSAPTDSWDVELLELVDSDRDWAPMLADVVGPDDLVGEVAPAAAADLGLPAGVLVGPGANDNPATALALGLRPGDVVVSLGTSGTVWAPSPDQVVDPTGYIYGAADATGIFMPLVCTLNAAKVTDAVARLLGVDHDEMAALALGAPARGDRAVLLPYLDGERSPDRPRARGELAGLRTDVTRGELARAAFEGVVLGLHDGLLALERAGVDTGGRLIATGGAAQSPAYRQFLADVFERPVHHPPLADAGAGIAVQAAAVAQGRNVADVAAEWAAPMAVCAEPRPHQGLDELRAGYDALRERTAERQSELATVSR